MEGSKEDSAANIESGSAWSGSSVDIFWQEGAETAGERVPTSGGVTFVDLAVLTPSVTVISSSPSSSAKSEFWLTSVNVHKARFDRHGSLACLVTLVIPIDPSDLETSHDTGFEASQVKLDDLFPVRTAFIGCDSGVRRLRGIGVHGKSVSGFSE
jgi:hypothetical protein